METSARAYLAELIGTFTLVFIGTSVATLQGFLGMDHAGWIGISFAFGFTLMVLVLTIGPVSGCHVNPAVTIPMAIAGRMKWGPAMGYVVVQCAGAILASGALLALMNAFNTEPWVYSLSEHGLGANRNALNIDAWALVGWEVVLTVLFLLVIFSVTRDDAMIVGSKSPGFAAPAIGGFLLVAHLVGVPLGDASLNPARSLGPALMEGGDALADLWVFLVGPVVGGVLGLGLYRLLHAD